MRNLPSWRSGTTHRAGSILLLSLLITGLIATVTLSFANAMSTQIQLSRDQAVTLQADLAAQSGLEYAKRQLRIDPLWTGTLEGPLTFAEGATFSIARKEGQGSKVLPTDVELVLEGQVEDSLARYETELQVNPGDPLMDKSVSVLGDVTGSNIRIDGDYMILDAPGWLWSFHLELIDDVEADPRLADTDIREDQLEIDMRSQAVRDGEVLSDRELYAKSYWYYSDGSWDNDWQTDSGSKVDTTSDWNWNDWKWESLSSGDSLSLDSNSTDSVSVDSKSLDSLSEDPEPVDPLDGVLMHVRKDEYTVEGVWLQSPGGETTYVALDRVDAPGILNVFSETVYAWAENQAQEDQPIHTPGWLLDQYLASGPKVRIFDRVTSVKDLVLDEIAVFVLDPGQVLELKNVDFKNGAVVWTETDYDFSGEPRNPIVLSGSNKFGRDTGSSDNIGLLAPGSSLTVQGNDRHDIVGYTVLHSLDQVQRFHHVGVLIVLNSATGVLDSSFLHDSTIAAFPPQGLTFFGDLPGVQVQALIESYDAPPLP